MSNSVKLLLVVVALVGAWAALSMLEPQTQTDGCGGDHAAGGG